jgi:Rho GDP-dissociation inhibitor
MADHHDDLHAEQTEGFVVGEKKTIDEYQNLGMFTWQRSLSAHIADPPTDKNDESLQKWKASLGLGQGKDISDPSDPRKCIILSLGLEVEGRDDIIIDLRSPGAVEALQKKPFTIKEGARFRMKAQFKVQHEILAGLKYLQKVSRMGVSDKMQEMMVSLDKECDKSSQ